MTTIRWLLIVAFVAGFSGVAVAQPVLRGMEVVAPRNSPIAGPSPQLIFAFLQNISSYYLAADLGRAQCVQATIAAVDDNCNVPGATADAEQFFREVMAGSLIAASGRSEYSRVANDFGYYLRDLGASGGPAAALSDLRTACDAAYVGSLRIACHDEMTLRLTRSLAEGGFGGLSAADAERMGRGRTCLDHVDDIEEFCGRAGGQ